MASQLSLPLYLLDTNICIYAMNGQLGVLKKFGEHGQAALAISSLVAAELAYGAENSQRVSQNKKSLDSFLQSIQILSWDNKAIWHYARQRRLLKEAGTPIGDMDLLIAAQTLAENLTLVTNNLREFERIEGLRLENWV